MHNLRHFYYKNKEKIWKVLAIIAVLLGIIYYFNYLTRKKIRINTNNAIVDNNASIYNDEENKTYISDKTAISGSTITEKEVEKINNNINKFIKYCNNGEIEQAYNMLSIDCKENQYNTIEKFNQNYINFKFGSNKLYEIENWINDTYKITISEDVLQTGNINGGKQIEYITIIKENSAEKLNINGYIGIKELNKETTSNKINITTLNKKTYMDYEEYEFKIENLSSKTIKLDTLEESGTIYLESKTGSKFNAYIHEIYNEDLEIKSKHSKIINIKFAKTYSNSANIDKLIFKNVILDYPKYKTEVNEKLFEEIDKITLEL